VEVKHISADQPPAPEDTSFSTTTPSQPKIPQKLQRAKVADAMKLVDRE
jgi:nucleoporin NUP82